jgi:hypothetical protein
MTQTSNSIKKPFDQSLLFKRMLLGGGIALILIAVFLLPVSDPDAEWGRLWMVRPLIIVPIAGAAGGSFYYFLDYLRQQNGWNKWVVILLSFFVYLVVLWMGTVLGLDGTLWD